MTQWALACTSRFAPPIGPRSIGSTPMALRLVAAITAVPACAPTTAPNYYAAFLLDPDGNNVEAVCLR